MIGIPWAHWSLICIFCMLLEGSTWQRFFVYLDLCAFATVATLIRASLLDIADEEIFQIAYAAPFLTIVIAVPTFLAKGARRWIVARCESNATIRPATTEDYFRVSVRLNWLTRRATSEPIAHSSNAPISLQSLRPTVALRFLGQIYVWPTRGDDQLCFRTLQHFAAR